MLYNSPEAAENLVHRFNDRTLPRAEWTHAAHLTVGLWHALNFPLDEAAIRVRSGIQAYNDACGILTTPDSGYHETVTMFYVWAIRKFLASLETPEASNSNRSASFHELANSLVASEYAEKTFPLRFYSKEALFSPEARVRWVEADVVPLERPFLPSFLH